MAEKMVETIPETITNSARRIKDSYEKSGMIDDEDLYNLLIHKISQEDNVNDVVKLANLGCPISPIGDIDVYALRLAIELDRPKTTAALLALGADVFFMSCGLNILQYTWRNSDATIFLKMIVTRVFEHRICLELKKIEANRSLKVIAEKLLQSLKENPENMSNTKDMFSTTDILIGTDPTDILCEAVKNKCPVLALFIYEAKALSFTIGVEGKTPLHHSLDSHAEMEEFLMSHLGALPLIEDVQGRKPLDLMPAEQRSNVIKKMAISELAKLDSQLKLSVDEEKIIKIKKLLLLYVCLYVTLGDHEDILSWRELYASVLEMLQRSIYLDDNETEGNAEEYQYSNKFDVNIKHGETTWIITLLQNAIHQFRIINPGNPHKNVQNGHQYMIFWLNQLKTNIIKLPGEKLKLQLKDQDLCINLSNSSDIITDAFLYNCKNKYHLFLHMLLSHAVVNPDSPLDNILQTHALHHAAKEGNLSAIAYLLHTCNVKRDSIDRYGNNAAHYSFLYGHNETGDYLIKIEPMLKNMENSSKKTPLDLKDANTVRLNKLKAELIESNTEQMHLIPKDTKQQLQWKTANLYEQTFYINLTKLHLELCILRKNVRKMTFSELALEQLIGFSNGETKTLFQEVSGLLEKVGENIGNINKYFHGKLMPAGSSVEGCRLDSPDEFDFNWILEWQRFVELTIKKASENSWTSHEIELSSQNQEICHYLSGANLVNYFYDIVREVLPECINFGECSLSLILPGIRKTRVGIALTLGWMGKEYKLLIVEVDYVPVIKVSKPIDREGHCPHLDINNEHKIKIAGKTWKYKKRDFKYAYIIKIGDGPGRFSTTLEESYLMMFINLDRKHVFLISKYIISILKHKSWYPRYIKDRYLYFCSKMFKLPGNLGFLLKNAFFRELEQVPNDEHWTKPWQLIRLKRIFLHMCRQTNYRDSVMDSLRPDMHNRIDASFLEGGRLPTYFAGTTEKPKSGLLVPYIMNILDELNMDDFF